MDVYLFHRNHRKINLLITHLDAVFTLNTHRYNNIGKEKKQKKNLKENTTEKREISEGKNTFFFILLFLCVSYNDIMAEKIHTL